MVVVGNLGLGYYDFQTEINQTDASLKHELKATVYELAFLLPLLVIPVWLSEEDYPFLARELSATQTIVQIWKVKKYRVTPGLLCLGWNIPCQ